MIFFYFYFGAENEHYFLIITFLIAKLLCFVLRQTL